MRLSFRYFLIAFLLAAICLLSTTCSRHRVAPPTGEIRAEVSAALRNAERNESVCGGVALVNWQGNDTLCESFGYASAGDKRVAMREDHVFDLASLTKVVATATAVMILRDRGLLSLDDPVARHLPQLQSSDKTSITIRQCMTHTAGLPAWRPFYKTLKGRAAFLQAIASEPLAFAPGTKYVYSDLGFILLGMMVEDIAGETLDIFTQKHIFAPLGMSQTGYRPLALGPGSTREFAATEECPWRKELMVGQVHDENAYAMGGVAGHAGLFSSARDLRRFGRMLLGNGQCEGVRILSPESVALFNRPQRPDLREQIGLAWQIRPPYESTLGFLASPRSFGHTGFTGTSLWIDPDNDMVAILLTNAVHPSRETSRIAPLRLAFHRAIVRGLGKSVKPIVRTGLDCMEAQNFQSLERKRVALVTNHTGINGNGEHILEVLKKYPQVHVTALFAPEHGFSGNVEAGEEIADSKGKAIPVYSLYGKSHKPDKKTSGEYDVMLFDMQDVGARFYTYIWTLFSVMQFCAEEGKPLIVLDRPNPIGGEITEGPILDEHFASFVGMKPIPLRHGLTIGELAVLFNEQGWLGKGLRANLCVVRMQGWRREMLFPDTGLPWVPPSPNIPTWQTAYVYPGTCLFEGVNWSEGRGLDVPFETVGGPGVDADQLAADLNSMRLPGCDFFSVSFVPRSLPGIAANPKYCDKQCGGVFIRVSNPQTFRPVRTALTILTTLRKHYPETFEWRASHFDVLLGTDTVRKKIDLGESPEAITNAWESDLQKFEVLRKKAMLY